MMKRSIFFLLSLCSMVFADASTPTVPVVILGGGIGGSTAALYVARSGRTPVVIEKEAGGLLLQTHSVQNWPGVLEIDGAKLSQQVHDQAAASGADFRSGEVTKVDFSKRPFTIYYRTPDGQEHALSAYTCIVALGSSPKKLGIPGESQYWGRGVSTCAACDGSAYKKQTVGIIGGGDAAVLEAMYLSNIASEVHMFVRKDHFQVTELERLQHILKKPNIQVHYQTEVASVLGDREGVTGVTVRSHHEGLQDLKLDGLFLAIGSTPNSALFKGQLETDQSGYIVLKQGQATSIEGVFAIGDIADPVYQQAISAAGDGAKAALQALSHFSSADVIVEEVAAVQSVVELTTLDQLESILEGASGPVVVDFYATWCGPCQAVSPRLESAAKQLHGAVRFVKVNVDQAEEGLTNKYKVRSMPTVLLFEKSKVTKRTVGSKEVTELLDQLTISE